MKDISEKRLSDYMAEQIADEILSGRIPGGSQLKQEELAEAFEASRIPIREAFQILENQGLIIRLATRRQPILAVVRPIYRQTQFVDFSPCSVIGFCHLAGMECGSGEIACHRLYIQ